jgi:hypothetical protein
MQMQQQMIDLMQDSVESRECQEQYWAQQEGQQLSIGLPLPMQG